MRVIISELIVTVSFDKIAEEFDPHRFESDTITIPFDIFENIQTSLMTRAIWTNKNLIAIDSNCDW